ncbi:retrovirus-related Pol polyprotein from transposon 297 [Trichonephila clavipes]|nr:retrovirus-related Pol polyprotein from transposon 297 [Trichonephila clavipes]
MVREEVMETIAPFSASKDAALFLDTTRLNAQSQLSRYKDVNGIQRKSRCNTVKHKIDTDNSAPIKQRPYRISTAERRVIEKDVQRKLKEDVIQSSESSWSSPVVLVKKKEW